jgi:hypothetical protein
MADLIDTLLDPQTPYYPYAPVFKTYCRQRPHSVRRWGQNSQSGLQEPCYFDVYFFCKNFVLGILWELVFSEFFLNRFDACKFVFLLKFKIRQSVVNVWKFVLRQLILLKKKKKEWFEIKTFFFGFSFKKYFSDFYLEVCVLTQD